MKLLKKQLPLNCIGGSAMISPTGSVIILFIIAIVIVLGAFLLWKSRKNLRKFLITLLIFILVVPLIYYISVGVLPYFGLVAYPNCGGVNYPIV